MIVVADLASHLAGRWSLDRTVDLRHSGQRAVVTGEARWGPHPDGVGGAAAVDLAYREDARCLIDRQWLPASRQLRFTFSGPSRAAVTFADGRPFYLLDLTAGRCEVEHLCGDDRYLGTISIESSTTLREAWVVSGPAKDYTSTTTLSRPDEH